MTHDHLVGRDIDSGEFKVGGALIIENDIGIGFVPGQGFGSVDGRLYFKVIGTKSIDIENRDSILALGGRRNFQTALIHGPGATVRGKTIGRSGIERGGT